MTASRRSLPIRAASPDLLPTRAHADDAGLDLKAATDLTLAPGERALVPTGVSIALDPDTVGLVCPRSGLAATHGITIVNAPGVIDSGYRGEIKVSLLNTDRSEACTISRGDRIAQLLVMPILLPTAKAVEDLGETNRGHKGFGSSGGLSAAALTGEEA